MTPRYPLRPRWLAPVVLLLSILASVGPAEAAPPAGRPAAASPAQLRRQARSHFLQAERHFSQRQYGAAIERYLTAHRLLPLPELLFNVAQSYRLKGEQSGLLDDHEQALAYYQRYLAVPQIAYREEAKEHAAHLAAQVTLARERAVDAIRERRRTEERVAARQSAEQRRLEAERALARARSLAEVEGQERRRQQAEQDRGEAELRQRLHQRRRRLLWAGAASAAAGVVLLAVGAKYGADTGRASSGLQEFLGSPAQGELRTWTPEAARLLQTGQDARRIAIGTLASGGALLAVGGALTYLGVRMRVATGERARLSLGLVPGGALLGGQF